MGYAELLIGKGHGLLDFEGVLYPSTKTAQEDQCQLSESATDRIRFPNGVLRTQRRNTKSDNGRDLTRDRYSSTLRTDAPFLRDYKCLRPTAALQSVTH